MSAKEKKETTTDTLKKEVSFSLGVPRSEVRVSRGRGETAERCTSSEDRRVTNA